MAGAVPLLQLYALMFCTGKNLTLLKVNCKLTSKEKLTNSIQIVITKY